MESLGRLVPRAKWKSQDAGRQYLWIEYNFLKLQCVVQKNMRRVFSTGSSKVPTIICLVRFKSRNYDPFSKTTQTLCFKVILEQRAHKTFEELVAFLYSEVLIFKIYINFLDQADGIGWATV